METAVLHRIFPALVSIALLPLPATGAGVPSAQFVEIGHSIDSFHSVASARFAQVDVDGDAVGDLVFTASAGSPVLFVLGRKSDGTIGFKQSDVIQSNDYIVRVVSWTSGSTPQVLLVETSGTVREFAGWPLRQQRTFSVVSGPVAAAAGDIDNDGADDLIVLTSSVLSAYRLDTGAQKWTLPVQSGTDLALVQLDADPALEIILAEAAPARVIDGATRAVEWSYIDGFGQLVAVGRLASGGGQQWVGARAWQSYTVFRAVPWSPLWSGKTNQDIGAIATADLDGNGRDAIVYGDGQWGSVRIIDSMTRLERFAIPNEGHGISAVIAADIDGDGTKEIVFSPRTSYDGDRLVTSASGLDGSVEWSYVGSVGGPFVASGIADVDGNGRVDVVAASGTGFGNGTIALMDLLTGTPFWRSPDWIGNANEPFYMTARRIAFRDRPQGPGKDIVLAGTSTYDGRIIVLDGITRDVLLQIGYYANGPMRSRGVKGLVLFDYDEDGIDDFVVATDPQTSGAQGALLQVFSGVDGMPLWTSVSMGNGFSLINDVIIAGPATGKPGTELVAVLPGSLRAYDSESGLLSWTLAVENIGAVFLPYGANGAELAVLGTDKVSFYDATTRQFLRQVTLPVPLATIAAPGGDAACLAVASDGKLLYVDGINGTVLAETPFLGRFPTAGSVISAIGDGCATATLATGTQSAFYRFRMRASDRLFADGFESP